MRRLFASLLCLGLVLAGAPPLRSEEAPEPSRSGRQNAATHLLNLALLVAGNDPADGGDPLPVPVAKAVNDIKDFLPYKHYKIYDSVMVRTSNFEGTRVELQGPDSLRYAGRFAYTITGDGKLNFHRFEITRATMLLETPRARSGDSDDATLQPPASPEVITTGFSVRVGETIVVGTSRLKNSGKALVVVLTVLPAK